MIIIVDLKRFHVFLGAPLLIQAFRVIFLKDDKNSAFSFTAYRSSMNLYVP